MADPLEVLLRRLPEEHQQALLWLAERRGRIDSRPWSSQVTGVPDAPAVKLTAQRGIHVPSKWDMALTVALTKESKYRDGDLERQSDGSWLLLLRAHEGADGSGLDSRWNRGLYNCYLQRVPVGVFMPSKGSQYEWLGLALVDHYSDSTRTFILHGPVTSDSDREAWGTLSPLRDLPMESPEWFVRDADTSLTDGRTRIHGAQVVRENRGRFRELLLQAYDNHCAVTPCDLPVALDAAHILPYLGRTSDTAANGLVLRADVHRLFDRYLIAVDTREMRLLVSPRLESTFYSDLAGRELHFPAEHRFQPNMRHLDLHRERFTRAV